jgi:hypothetical protein
MSNYTLYNIESLELKGIVDTLLPIEHYLDDNTSYIEGSYKNDSYYLKIVNGKVTPTLKDNFTAELVSLSVYNDLNYYTIFNNIPANTEIFIDENKICELSASDNFEFATDSVGIFQLEFINPSYNSSNLTYNITSYAI